MEVACSLEDVARVLADNGYNLNDDSCFANAADLPSVLSALDSPDSFPESPCSDEDIARVLDIARMPSPSLLDSCTPNTNPFSTHNYHHHNPHNHHNQLPITPTEGHPSYDVGIHKTKDPCITNAVLQTSFLPSFNPVREHHQSMDLFSIALNCSFHDDNAPVFNTLVSSKDNDAFNNYFNSSSALSPVSETDTILPGSCEPISKTLTPHPTPLSHTLDPYPSSNSSFDQLTEHKTNPTTSDHLPPSTETPSINLTLTPNQIVSPNTSPEENKPQTKRKRRRKSSHVTPKSKRRKQQDKSNVTPDPNPKTSPKPKVTKPKLSQTASKTSATSSTSVETNAKRKCSNSNSNSGPKKPRKSKNCNIISTLETISESSSTEIGVDVNNNNVSLGNQSSAGLDPATEGIGSTNGVTDEPKGPRRSSRSTRNTENYNFRLSSLVKRVETERKQQEPKQPKGKVKPPPLSKYRRRTANARERDRMKEINDAFDVLKNALPDMEPEEGKSKITKFTILKLALNYISSLQDMLGLDPSQPNPEYIGDIISSSELLDSECAASFSDNSSNINNDIIPSHGQQSENDNNALTTKLDSPTSSCGMKIDQTSEHLGRVDQKSEHLGL